MWWWEGNLRCGDRGRKSIGGDHEQGGDAFENSYITMDGWAGGGQVRYLGGDSIVIINVNILIEKQW